LTCCDLSRLPHASGARCLDTRHTTIATDIMPSVETPNISKAGITTSATGERHIPASLRPDGSLRKEIRVRPGYRPPEDVEVYKNRTAEGFRNRGKTGVPGAEGLKSEEKLSTSSPAANKNAKRREARKKAAAAGDDGNEEEVKPTETKEKEAAKSEPEKPVDPAAEREKEAKKLMKKLRQARDLKDKKEQGDKLLPEQFEKVIKINELIRQLEGLGFDQQGEKKPKT
jgi:partner of Y14 and mago protein